MWYDIKARQKGTVERRLLGRRRGRHGNASIRRLPSLAPTTASARIQVIRRQHLKDDVLGLIRLVYV